MLLFKQTLFLFQLQTPQSFSQSVNELIITLQRTGDPCTLQKLQPHLEFLASIDPNPGRLYLVLFLYQNGR